MPKNPTYIARTPAGDLTRTTHRTYTHVVTYPETAGQRRAGLVKGIGYLKSLSARYAKERDQQSTRWTADDYNGWIAKNDAAIAADQARIAALPQDDAAILCWYCAGWCGRLDLAQKLALKHAGAVITPVEPFA